MIAMLKTTLCG